MEIDTEKHINIDKHEHLSPSQKSPIDVKNRGLRAKTTLRLKYEAESEVIRKQIGSLETIRKNLGLSKRKISQLLLVDPSAWTRWVKNPKGAPPYIYRALEWLFVVKEKHPALGPSFWLKSVSESRLSSQDFWEEQSDLQKSHKLLENRLFQLENQFLKEKRRLIVFLGLGVSVALLLGFFIGSLGLF